MKWRWRARRAAEGHANTGQLILGSNVQVVMGEVLPLLRGPAALLCDPHYHDAITPRAGGAAVDEKTIGVVAIVGTTFTGEFEPVRGGRELAGVGGAQDGHHADGVLVDHGPPPPPG